MPFAGLTGSAVYAGLYAVSFWGLTLGFGIRVRGRRHVPRSGPVLFVANHQSYLDPWFVSLAVAPRKLTHLARSTLFTGGAFEWAIRGLGALPIDRGFGKAGVTAVLDELKAGAAVVVFAEGERTRTGEVQPLKPGVALLAQRAYVPVVPVGLAGAYAVWPRHAPYPRPNPLLLPDAGRRVSVAVGEPVPPGAYAGMDREDALADLERRVRAAAATAAGERRASARC